MYEIVSEESESDVSGSFVTEKSMNNLIDENIGISSVVSQCLKLSKIIVAEDSLLNMQVI